MPLIKKENENDFSKAMPLSWFEQQGITSSLVQNQLRFVGDSLVPITDGGVERIYKDRLNNKGEIIRYNEDFFIWNGAVWCKLSSQSVTSIEYNDIEYDDNPFSSEWSGIKITGTSNT